MLYHLGNSLHLLDSALPDPSLFSGDAARQLELRLSVLRGEILALRADLWL
jgi:hypothetical protein